MRPRHEGGVAQQRHASEHHARRFEIEDRLEERLRRARENLGHLRRHERARGRLDGGGDLRPDQRRRDRRAVAAAGGVGAEVGQRLVRVGRAVPDDVVGASPRLRLVVAAGNRIGQEQLALRQAEGVALENLGADVGRHLGLVEHGAPGDVAGVVGLQVRQELLAHGGAHAVGGDQQVSAHARAVGEHGGDAVGILLDPRRATCRGDSSPDGSGSRSER